MKVNKRQKPLSKKVKTQKANNSESDFYLKIKTRKFMSNFKEVSAEELWESRCKAYNYMF